MEWITDEEFRKTKCSCKNDKHELICYKHYLLYCLICDGILCPKCESDLINSDYDEIDEENR
jgi:hypothetical protein